MVFAFRILVEYLSKFELIFVSLMSKRKRTFEKNEKVKGFVSLKQSAERDLRD